MNLAAGLRFGRAGQPNGGIYAIHRVEVVSNVPHTPNGDAGIEDKSARGFQAFTLVQLRLDRELIAGQCRLPLDVSGTRVIKQLVVEFLQRPGWEPMRVLLIPDELAGAELAARLKRECAVDVLIRLGVNAPRVAEMLARAQNDRCAWRTYFKIVWRQLEPNEPLRKVRLRVRAAGFARLVVDTDPRVPLNGILQLAEGESLDRALGLLTTLPIEPAIQIDKDYSARWEGV